MTCLDGVGTSLDFATTGFSAELIDLDGPGLARESLDSTHLGSTAMTSCPAALVDPGELSVTFAFDPDAVPPIDEPAEVMTITWPLPAGMATPATWSAEGYMTSYSPGAAIGERMTASATIKLSGLTTFVPAA